MRASQLSEIPEGLAIGADRRDALERCSAVLAREGFLVSWVGTSSARGSRTPDLLATVGSRVVRVIVLLDREIDGPGTRSRIRAALREGETRVCVPWTLRWRMLSNLERWGLSGVSVAGV